MKVLGMKESNNYGEKIYITEISSNEIKQIFNKSWNDKEEYRELKCGDIINLGDGYFFREEIKTLSKSMKESHEQFLKSSNILFELSKLLLSNDDAKD